jgi:chromosome segregation protein
MQLADSQERHAQLDERVIEAERKPERIARAAAQLERQAQEATFSQRSAGGAARRAQRTIETASQQAKSLAEEQQRAMTNWPACPMPPPRRPAGCTDLKMEREKGPLAPQRIRRPDQQAAPATSAASSWSALDPLRQRITEFQLKSRPRAWVEQYSLLTDAEADLAAVAQSIAEGNVRLHGLQGEIDRLHREIAALGAVNLAALDELSARERKTFLDAQMDDLTEAMNTLEDAIRKIDGETRELLSGTFDTVNATLAACFPSCSAAARPSSSSPATKSSTRACR